ncbi:DUF7373 family lipoprotein [Nocardia arthritidis]|uniref:Uncharacterized protein n=1 Tax=Nocardia arthritidis TaxID=228602 RepID=A0A6G9Y7H0_9NOCA|nr:hypothetical protein [Nocardia arthritidis]QIS09060.1 hypothetical protein F5544_05740 [Nocardia arthritidis]
MRGMTRGALAVTIGLLTGALVACGSTYQGTALPGEIDIRKLDVGPYNTVPSNAHDDDYLPNFNNMRDVGAMRLIDYVASAYDIDPRLKYGWLTQSLSAGVPADELGKSDVAEAIGKKDKLLFGIKVTGGDKRTTFSSYDWGQKQDAAATTITTVVNQFADTDGAKQAGDDFYQAQLDRYQGQNVPVTLPKYPAAHAHWRPDQPYLWADLTYGSYLVTFYVSTPKPDLAALTALAEKSFDTQLPLLDQVKPVSDEEMLGLPWDPDHLITRTLNPDKYDGPSFLAGGRKLLGQRGMLAYAEDRDFLKNRLAALHADRYAVIDRSVVARTADEKTAEKVVADKNTLTRTSGETAPPLNVPGAKCFQNSEDRSTFAYRFSCVVSYRRYVGFVSGQQLLDAQQRAAAQYALFANSGD